MDISDNITGAESRGDPNAKEISMQRRLRWVLIVMTLATMYTVCAPVMAADSYIFKIAKKPAYARALKSLLDQTPDLPSWTHEALKSKSRMIGTPMLYVPIGGITYELVKECMPYNCDVSELLIMFAPHGTRAWGALVDKGPILYLGAPSDAQAAVLKGSFSIDPAN